MSSVQEQSLISIIVPVYQVEKHLPACLDSVLSQTYPYWELLLVDDGSTDGSARICRDYAQRDGRILVIRQENQGVSAARNRGIAQARGAYLAFLDADDRIEPDYLETLYRDMVSSQADLVCCNAWEECEGVRRDYRCVQQRREIQNREKLYLDALVRKEQYAYTVWGKLMRAELAKGLSFPALRFGEDTYFMLLLFAKASRVLLDSYTGYIYVRHPGGVMLQSGMRDVSRRMDQLAAQELCFSQTQSMCEQIRTLSARNLAEGIHAAAAATVLAGSDAFWRARGRLLDDIALLRSCSRMLSLGTRGKLALYARIPAVYRVCIRLLKWMGRTA